MSATATAKTRSSSKRETKGKNSVKDGDPTSNGSKKRGTSEKQKAANQRNSEKSTGPRTPEGKRNSKYNAYKHGMTARSVLLPGEKAEDLAAHQQHFIDSFQPRHAVELAIVERMALDIWRADRAERGAGVRIAERLRHEPLEKAEKEQEEADRAGGPAVLAAGVSAADQQAIRRGQNHRAAVRREPRPSASPGPIAAAAGADALWLRLADRSLARALAAALFQQAVAHRRQLLSWCGFWASTRSTWSTTSTWCGCFCAA